MATAPGGEVSEIIRRGTLRAGLFQSFMHERDPATGEPRGVAVELGRLLATELGVEPVMVEHLAPPQVIASLRTGACDMAFLGIDPGRGSEVDFSPPLMRADFTYLVPAGSLAATIEEVDRAGVRVAVVRNHAMEIALRGTLKHATPVYADTPAAAVGMLVSGDADVSAGIRPGLIGFQRALPGSRVLAGNYGSNTIAMAVLKGRPELLDRVCAFVREAKASGAAQRALDASGLAGVEVPVS